MHCFFQTGEKKKGKKYHSGEINSQQGKKGYFCNSNAQPALLARKRALFWKCVEELVYYTTRERKVYFVNVKFDARAKRDQQSHSQNKCFFY